MQEDTFYQITGNQVTFRVNDTEKKMLNDFAVLRQIKENKTFTNAKQIVFELLSIVNNSVNNENNTEINETTHEIIENEQKNVFEIVAEAPENQEVNEIKQQLIESIGYTETPTDEQLFTDLLEIITTPLEPAPTVEVVKEVVKEVERPLTANEVLLNLTPQQRELIELITRWRFQQKRDTERLTTEKAIKRMVFNAGTLSNYHGEFETGIPLNKLNKNKGLQSNN
jgi:hypothetical protein